MRSIGLVAQAFSSGEQFLRSPELSRTGCHGVDFDMPRMNGLICTTFVSIGQRDSHRMIKLPYPAMIFVPAYFEPGSSAYLTKPFDRSDLLNCISGRSGSRKGN